MNKMLCVGLMAICVALSACGGGGGGGVLSEAVAATTPAVDCQGSADCLYQTLDGENKAFGRIKSPFEGYLKAGTVGFAEVDMAGVGGTAVGAYGFASMVGAGGGRQREGVGIYGRVNKQTTGFAFPLHGECINQTDQGGTCVGVNIEMRDDFAQTAKEPTGFIGANIQPSPEMRNVVGMQFQNPQAYRWAIDLQGAPIRLGEHGGVSMCLRLVDGQIAVNPC